MLQILNSKERNQAFFKFLIFFLITVILIVWAIFFDYKMPVRENSMLQDKLTSQRQQEYNQQVFVQRMQETIQLLDSLDKPGTNQAQVSNQLSAKLSDLGELQGSSNTLNGKMNKVIVDRLADLHQTKQSNSKKSITLTELESQLRTCKAELEKAQDRIDRLDPLR